VSNGSSDENLSVDGFTFSDFHTIDENDPGIVSLLGSTGQLTVLNSTFTDNVGYSAVKGWGEGGQSPSVVVDKSVFENNIEVSVQIWGKSDVTVTDSTFSNNSIGSQIWVDYWADDPTVLIAGNYFGNNSSENYVAFVANSDGTALIANNTFANNSNSDPSEAVVLEFGGNQDPTIAFNTFVNNTSVGGDPGDIMIEYNTDATLLGNIWISDAAVSLGKYDDTDTTAHYIDAGGNFSTTSESAYLDDPSSSSNVAESALDLSAPADNGGPTWTAALGAGSVAIDAVSPSVAADVLGQSFDVDQRGDDRVGDIDAGAFEFGELAATGVDATGIALTGGVLGAAGVALVARRRRKA
jgi:LPXTG-motif cell wall-anchored protein